MVADTVVADTVVADKGYHRNQTLVDLTALGVRTYIALVLEQLDRRMTTSEGAS